MLNGVQSENCVARADSWLSVDMVAPPLTAGGCRGNDRSHPAPSVSLVLGKSETQAPACPAVGFPS